MTSNLPQQSLAIFAPPPPQPSPRGGGSWPVLSLATLFIFLTSCAAWHPPKPDMPARSSITAGQTVVVEPNQNIYALALVHKVPMRELIVLNNLQPPYRLKPGQQITLPATAGEGGLLSTVTTPISSSSVISTSSTQISTSLTPTSVESAPLDPIEPVKPKTTPFAPATSAPVKKVAPVEELNAPKPAAKSLETTSTKEASPAASDAEDTVDTSDAPEFAWPVQGPVISSFGAKGGGLNNDGVNIGAPKGSPVTAAAGGTVVYAGNGMKGFGNLILIRHEGEYVTAYAHLDRMLVTKDSIVAKGDMIGTVGKTGNVTSPQLHFEIRQDSKPVNPKGLIK